ncbi:MAG: rhodanese-like domain-containing protein [Proteobacteria bacterium]|nr:rhodanese-like domain-containing protein [Pseudomonadota bacterium]
MNSQKTIKEAVVILALALITAFSINFISPRGIALVGQWDTSQGVVSARTKNDVVHEEREINDIMDAKAVFDEHTAVFVDARRREEFEEGHVKGAVPFPVKEYENIIESFIESNPFDVPLVIYCSGRECEDSHVLASYLSDEGYLNARVMVDGFPLWQSKGFPVEK